MFPHHENEIAQSRCAFGHDVMARVWMHNGHLQVEGEKMSKSLGNFVTIRDLWNGTTFGGRKWSGNALRLAMLRTHYRQPIDFTTKGLEEAERTIADFARACGETAPARPSDAFLDAMADDMNTPKAIAELHALRTGDPAALRGGLGLLGIEAQPVAGRSTLSSDEEALIELRSAARTAKNWAESDRLRDRLAASGVAVKDNKDGTITWSRL